MADVCLIHIYQDRIQTALSAAEGREWSPVEVRAWLIEQRFEPVEEGWIAEEISLRALQRNEYVRMRTVI